jgi:hypothetical protein
MLSGSGLTVLPTATIAPPTEFRVQLARMDYLKSGYGGANVFTMTTGFSPNLEGYARVMGEQLGTYNSQLTYSFGGKFRVPGTLPVVRHLAFWLESTQSDAAQPGVFFPPEGTRAAAVATFDSNGVHPSFLLGYASIYGGTNVIAGAGLTVAVSHDIQLGAELLHGYLERNSAQIILNGAYRLLPNLSLHVSPGYMSTSAGATPTVSLGISCTTAGIDFHPAQVEQKTDDYIMPSIDDIEKQLKQAPAGADSLHNGN